jgi:hypothetical protein
MWWAPSCSKSDSVGTTTPLAPGSGGGRSLGRAGSGGGRGLAVAGVWREPESGAGRGLVLAGTWWWRKLVLEARRVGEPHPAPAARFGSFRCRDDPGQPRPHALICVST